MRDCPLYGAHHWKLDSKDYGKCACGEEKDFAPKEKKSTRSLVPKVEKFEREFYLQGDLKGIDKHGEWEVE